MAQQAGQSAAYRYNWLASCSTRPTGFAITGVNSVSCQAITPSQHVVRFTPQYQTQSSEPISFSVVNEMSATTVSGPYSLRVYADNSIVTLWAQQATYRYDWLSGCQAGARRAAESSSDSGLRVVVLGNPVTAGELVELAVRGAEGQALSLRIVNGQGRPVDQFRVERATVVERHRLKLGPQAGVYLLEVVTPSHRQTLKLVRQ